MRALLASLPDVASAWLFSLRRNFSAARRTLTISTSRYTLKATHARLTRTRITTGTASIVSHLLLTAMVMTAARTSGWASWWAAGTAWAWGTRSGAGRTAVPGAGMVVVVVAAGGYSGAPGRR